MHSQNARVHGHVHRHANIRINEHVGMMLYALRHPPTCARLRKLMRLSLRTWTRMHTRIRVRMRGNVHVSTRHCISVNVFSHACMNAKHMLQIRACAHARTFMDAQLHANTHAWHASICPYMHTYLRAFADAPVHVCVHGYVHM